MPSAPPPGSYSSLQLGPLRGLFNTQACLLPALCLCTRYAPLPGMPARPVPLPAPASPPLRSWNVSCLHPWHLTPSESSHGRRGHQGQSSCQAPSLSLGCELFEGQYSTPNPEPGENRPEQRPHKLPKPVRAPSPLEGLWQVTNTPLWPGDSARSHNSVWPGRAQLGGYN